MVTHAISITYTCMCVCNVYVCDKDKLFADLQGVIDGISGSDVLMIVGDFNARVGSGERGEDV